MQANTKPKTEHQALVISQDFIFQADKKQFQGFNKQANSIQMVALKYHLKTIKLLY